MSLPAPYQEHYYIGDGITVTFPFGSDFKALAEANVKCIIYFDDGTNCVPTFTVNMEAGSITIVTLTKPDGTVLTVPPVGSVVRVFRETPEQQNVTASQLQNYTAKQLEKIFDSIVAMIQENGYTAEHKTIRLTETQRDVSLQNMSEDEDQCLLYWDEETGTIKSTSYTHTGIKAEVERANEVADQAKSIAQTTQGNLTVHTSNMNNPHLTSVVNLTDTTISSPSSGQFLRFNGTKWENSDSDVTSVDWGEIEGTLTDQTDLKDALDAKVNVDGTSVMTGPLKMADGSMRGAVSPFLNGVGFFKMDSQYNLTNIANLSDTQFYPVTTNTISLGASSYKWKDLYLAGDEYLDNGKRIRFAGTVSNRYFDIETSQDEIRLTHKYGSYNASLSFRAYTGDVVLYPQNDDKALFGLPTRRWQRVYATNLCSDTSGANLISIPNKAGTIALLSDIVSSSVFSSNCITEIPQDINLTLSAGTLTLKAGSKVYFADGSSYTTTSDKTRSGGASGKVMIVYRKTSNDIVDMGASQCYSGTTQPTGVIYAVWFDITNNIVKWTSDGFSTWQECSFPVALTTFTSNVPTSIDQVFNGLGYVGSTVFALPGVKGLVPNGRNADGTLKTTAFEISSVKTTTSGVTANYTVGLNGSAILLDSLASYSEQENYNSGTSRNYAFVGSLTNTSGVISNFNIKSTFHAVDYNDFAKVADTVSTNTNNIASLSSGKADVNLLNTASNVDFVIESQEPTALNNYMWYRKYRSGWVQQGCLHVKDNVAFTFPVPMADTNYSVMAVSKVGAGETKATSVREDLKTTTDCIVYFTSNQYYGYVVVEGKAA